MPQQFNLFNLKVLGLHTFSLVEKDLAMVNRHLRLMVPSVSHFALAERDLTIKKLSHKGEAFSVCKLALVERYCHSESFVMATKIKK